MQGIKCKVKTWADGWLVNCLNGIWIAPMKIGGGRLCTGEVDDRNIPIRKVCDEIGIYA